MPYVGSANPGRQISALCLDKIDRTYRRKKLSADIRKLLEERANPSASAVLRDKLANPRTRVEVLQNPDPLKALEPDHAKELLAMRIHFEPKLALELLRIAHPSETSRKR